MTQDLWAFYESQEYYASQELFKKIGSRTNFETVMLIADSYDVRLADQSSRVGDPDIIEITGIFGVMISRVMDTYFKAAHAIFPDNHVSVPWARLVDGNENSVILNSNKGECPVRC